MFVTVDFDFLGDITSDLQRGDILRLDVQHAVLRDRGMNRRRVKVVVHLLDRQPVAFVVLQRVGGEPDFLPLLRGQPAPLNVRSMKCHELFERVRMKLVLDSRPDQELDLDVAFLGGIDHQLAGSELLVEFSAVGADRHVESVERAVERVVDVQRGTLMFRQRCLGILIVEVIDEAGPRPDRAPLIGMMHSEMPTARSAHREAPKHDSTIIDPVAAFHVGDRFKDVGLAGPAVRVVDTAKDVKLHEVSGTERPILRPRLVVMVL